MDSLTILNTLCVTLPVVFFLSPITVFGPVFCGKRDNAEETPAIEMPPLAVTSQMLQCYLFAIYAQYFRMKTLFIPNIIGFPLGFLWSTLYCFRATPQYMFQWRWQYWLSIAVMLFGTWTTFSRDIPYVASSIAAFVGIFMCTFPFPVMVRTMQTRNSALLGSVYMNLAMFACCTAWVIHSSPFVQWDPFVLVSNGAGVLVQGGALALRIYLLATGHGGLQQIEEIYAENTSGQVEEKTFSVSTPLL